MSIGVILADDHHVFRQGLRALLDKQADVHVVGEAQEGRSATRLAHEHPDAVVILDVAMPDMNGIEATRQIVAKSPDARVIALSMHPDQRFVSAMLKAGAKGYLHKTCDVEELLDAIRAVHGGQVYLSSRILNTLVDDYVRQTGCAGAAPDDVLTAKEREVVQLVAEGKSTKQIAAHLNVSVKTIETHRWQAMKKLGMHSVAELTKYAVREGLTPL